MNEHRYILEPYKGMNSRYHCPKCNQRDKTFARYIDTETGEHLPQKVGRCNRESNCGYHYTPKQYFQDNSIKTDFPKSYAHTRARAKSSGNTPLQKPISHIPVEVFKGSLKEHGNNNFVKFIIDLFRAEIASQLISRYFIGTSNYWDGATVFWQIDMHGKVRTGKIMLYSPITGRRIKEPFKHINWVHSVLKMPDFELEQCLFGEHLLKVEPTKPIAIVESEKTALIASVYLPKFIWLAVGSLTNLNAEKCSVLKGRNITLFPDLNGFEKWSIKAKELSYLTNFIVSDLLERKATEAERLKGLDLADYLIRFNYKDFAIPEQSEQPPAVPQLVEVKPIYHSTNSETPKPDNWEHEIMELEHYFNTATLPAVPVQLNSFSTITDISLFIQSHLTIVKANNGKRRFLPDLNRLQELRQYLTENQIK